MSARYHSSRKGVLIVVVVGVLLFSMIIFLSLVDRVRHESAVTNRVSVNERLYQIASAVGRLAVRKLQKDFETRDPEFGQKIINAAFSDKSGSLESVDYTKVVRGLDVVKEIMKQFKKEWGDRGEIEFNVSYVANLGIKFPFQAPIKGLENSPYERKGYIDFIVKVSHLGIEKTCKMRKEFILSRLLAPPFHRFTLFSHRGATLSANFANQSLIKDDGKLQGGKRPLVCLNRLVKNKRVNQADYDSRLNSTNIVRKIDGIPTFVKNGWIFLGGRGPSKDSAGDDGNLILNVLTGSQDDLLESTFGEFFHFYFNPNSAGWLISKDWTEWFNNKMNTNIIDAETSRVMIAFVDYGYYKGLWAIPFRNNYLFTIAVNQYKKRISDEIDSGNSLHLFGTPALCTPTLVFGKIKRRYVRTFAFYFTQNARVYPLRAFSGADADSKLYDFTSKEVADWYRALAGNNADELFIQDFYTAFATNLDSASYQVGFPNNTPSLCGLDPEIRDWEPYMMGLHNIADPGGPDRKWSEVVPKNGYVDESPEPLCKMDYQFNNDKEINYTGSIREIKVDSGYLRDRMSYLIPGEPGKPTYLSRCDFFKNHFITEEKGEKVVYLNQIIGFDGDLVVDMPLQVAKGGVIICKGSITINQPVTNPYLSGGSAANNNPDSFGYLTFISEKEIVITAGKSGLGPIPQTHGFFVAANGDSGKVRVDKTLHIVGGVASDDIRSLVENGCVLEWGFEPEELAGGKDMKRPDFYGLAMGPRDLEIITEEKED